ncbi:MAG TPA: hypothetical protein VM101_12610 [Flavitalea sp.]|nr:hypothetical protein [Flavitalea sp.]
MADKKIDRNKLPHPEKTNKEHKSQEEFDDKAKAERDSKKGKKVNHIAKDLPIY